MKLNASGAVIIAACMFSAVLFAIIPEVDDFYITLHRLGTQSVPTIILYDDRPPLSSQTVLRAWLISHNFVQQRYISKGFIPLEERNKMILERKALNAIDMVKSKNDGNGVKIVHTMDELSLLLKSEVRRDGDRLIMAERHYSYGKGDVRPAITPTLPIPKNTICIGFTLPATTSRRIQNIYMNVLNSMILMKSQIRGVLFDNTDLYVNICQYNQFVCIHEYDLDIDTQQPLLSSLLDKLQSVKWGSHSCSFYGLMSSHMLLSPSLDQIINEIEEKLIPFVHNVILLGRRLNSPTQSVLQFSSMDEYSDYLDLVYIQTPLYAENQYSYLFFKKGTVSTVPYSGYIYDDKDIFNIMATRYLTNRQITVIDLSDASVSVYQEDENEEGCNDVKTAGYFINNNYVRDSTALWARFYNRMKGAPSISAADYRIKRLKNSIHILRCDGYTDYFTKEEEGFLQRFIYNRYCLVLGEGAARGSIMHLCKNGTYVYYHHLLAKENLLNKSFKTVYLSYNEKIRQGSRLCFTSDHYLTEPIGIDSGDETYSYIHNGYDAIILDGAEKTKFLTNIYPYLRKNTVVIVHDTNTLKYSKLVDDLLVTTSLNLISVFSDPLYPTGISVFKKTE